MRKLIKISGISILSLIGIIIIGGFASIQSIKNPHICLNLSDKFLQHDRLLLAEIFTRKGIRMNTIENLQKVHGQKAPKQLALQRDLENGHLYSQYAWIKYKKKELGKAENYIREAIRFKENSTKPSPVDIIRSGIISYEMGNKETGWSSILKAVLEDSSIENHDPAIKSALEKITREKTAMKADLDDCLESIRYEYAETLPDIDLCISDSIMNMRDFSGKPLYILFFNPACGSCRQALSGIAEVCTERQYDGTDFIFILNQPERFEQAGDLLDDSNLKEPLLAVLHDRDAYDLILEEPTAWIVSSEGKILYKHVGYRHGDATIHINEIEKLKAN